MAAKHGVPRCIGAGRTTDPSIRNGSMKQASSAQARDPWQVLLKGASANIGLPSDRSRGSEPEGREAVTAVACDVAAGQAEALSALADALDVDARRVLLAAWIAWRWRMSGQQGVLLGVGDGAGGVLALDVEPESGWTLRELLAHVDERSGQARGRGVLDGDARR